jgi:ubiquinone/menaquinone biosynthesis C-methylase UbiE/uncharacterized protein YbaR (Trm112 family)
MLLIDAKKERDFQKKHIERQKEKYLKTDVIQKYKYDYGYSMKIKLFESFLTDKNENSFILDVGANTAGEAEVLAFKGYKIIATDINEIALSYSFFRSKKFRKKNPIYYAADAHNLPFEDDLFDNVITFEVLHHLENVEVALKELYRVLKPGGKIFAYEPYAYNPYRRLAELRYYLIGSIEKSFSKKVLRNIFYKTGFKVKSIEKHALPPSDWKKKHVSLFRAHLKDLYFYLSKTFLPLFGNLLVVAEKPVTDQKTLKKIKSIHDHLICPITKTKLVFKNGGFVSSNQEDKQYFYRIYQGVPVLIETDGIEYNHNSWP